MNRNRIERFFFYRAVFILSTFNFFQRFFCRSRKRKQAKSSLANLTPGNPSAARHNPRKNNVKRTRTVGTGTTAEKNRINPSAGTYTINDARMDKVAANIECIDKARPQNDVRTQKEIIMLLQFVFRSMTMDRLSLSESVRDASTFFR